MQTTELNRDEAETEQEYDESFEGFRLANQRSLQRQDALHHGLQLTEGQMIGNVVEDLRAIVPSGWCFRVNSSYGHIEDHKYESHVVSIWRGEQMVIEVADHPFKALSAAKAKFKIILDRDAKRFE
jgi:hypothetical protein